jgi:succinoglycan biosynthesis transport protein ExoP
MAEYGRAANQEAEEAGFDFLGFLWRRSWLALFFGTIGAGAAYYYYLQQPVRYSARAQVLVIKQQADLPVSAVNGFDPTGNRDPLANDVRLISSEGTVGPAVEAARLNELPSLAASANPVQAILADLSVNRTALQGDVLEISYKGSDPEDCAKIVNAVVASYDLRLKEAYQDVGAMTAKLLGEAKQQWESTLKKSEDDYTKFRQNSSLLFNGDSATSVHQTRMTEIEAQRSQVIIAQTDVQAQLDSIQKAIDKGGSREAILLMVEAFGQKGESDNSKSSPSLMATLFPLLLEEQLMLEEVGPDHPKVKAIRKRIEMTENHMQNLANTDGTVVPDANQKKDFLTIYIESLRQQLQASHERLQQLDALFEREADASKKQADLQITDRRLQNEIARSTQLFNTIVDRLKEVDLATKGGQYKAEVITPATRGYQVEPNFKKTMMMGSVLGALVGLLLGFLVETADKSFRTPDEISQVLGLPLVGISPQFQAARPSTETSFGPAVITVHRPRSQSAEAFRGVRTHLLAGLRDEVTKVILVTSPEPGDGKSTMASNLAVAMAQSGKSVLLIDADMRRPTVHTLIGLERSPGLSDLLENTQATVDSVIHSLAVEGGLLHVIPAGNCPRDPGERLMSQRFIDLLGLLRDKFEWIIIDSPPVLAVTDSATIAREVTGVLLVVRMNGRTRMAAIRAVESLRNLGANVLGVVANGIDPTKHGGYGYEYGVYGASKRASKYYVESSEGR